MQKGCSISAAESEKSNSGENSIVMEMLRNMIGQIGVFMICAQAVVHFKPKESYGKYLRLLLGLMVMVQVFSPVYGLLFGAENVSLAENIQQFQEEMEERMGTAAENSVISGLQLEDMSLKMLQELLVSEQNGTVVNGETTEAVGREKDAGKEKNDGTVTKIEIEIAPIAVGRGEP